MLNMPFWNQTVPVSLGNLQITVGVGGGSVEYMLIVRTRMEYFMEI